LEAGLTVRGLTRGLELPKAKRLEELGVELVEGDLDQLDTVRKGLSVT
jgi:hypothetical protein